jgi:hypothetical protein
MQYENALRPIDPAIHNEIYKLVVSLRRNGKRVDHMLIFYSTDCKDDYPGRF